MPTKHDNWKAGLFVLLGLLTAMACVVLLGGSGQWGPQQAVAVQFSLADGVRGLKPDADVTLGGQPVGSVLDIRREPVSASQIFDDPTTQPEPVTHRLLVEFAVPQDIALYQNARVELVIPPLGDNSSLNIRSVGQGEPYDYGEDPPLMGRHASSRLTRDLTRDMGIREVQRQQIAQMIGDLAKLAQVAREEVPVLLAEFEQRLEQAKPVLDEMDATLGEARQAVSEIKVVSTNLRERHTGWMDDIDASLKNVDQLTRRVDEFIAAADPKLRASVGDVRELTRELREKALPQVEKLLSGTQQAVQDAQTSLKHVKGTTEDLRGTVAVARPMVERILANLSLTASQLKLASVEVRRAPWRLLYKPKDEELAYDNLYDAARSFAMAAESLDTAAASLARLSETNPGDTERIEQMHAYLQELFSRFRKAEVGFWRELGVDPGELASPPEPPTTQPSQP